MPLSKEELEYQNATTMGVQAPARVGTMTLESLQIDAPALPTNTAPLGLVETIRDRARALTGQHGNQWLEGDEHARMYNHGPGTLFVNDEELKSVLGPRYYEGTPKEYKPVAENVREVILKGLVGGIYPNVGGAMANDTLGAVEATSNQNGTYLPEHTRKLMAKVGELLPAARAAKDTAGGKAARK